MKLCAYCPREISLERRGARTCGADACVQKLLDERRARRRRVAEQRREEDTVSRVTYAEHPCARCEQPTTNRMLCSLCFRDEDRLPHGDPPHLSDDELARFKKNLHALERHIPQTPVAAARRRQQQRTTKKDER